jgi:eukaryotic-like serine/threonine-protein kinase
VTRVRDGEFGSPARRSGPHGVLGNSSASPARRSPIPPAVAAPEVAPSLDMPTPRPNPPRRQHLAVLLVLLIGVLGVVFFGDRGSARLVPNRVAIAPFQVLDSSLGVWQEGMLDVISRNLDKAGPLRTVSPAVVIRHWRGRVDEQGATDLGRATDARFVIVGSLQPAGPDSVRATAMAVDASTGQMLREVERRQSVSRMDLLADSLTVAILDVLGERLPIGAFEEGSLGTVSSLEALKEFLTGEQFYRRSRWDSAAAHYQRALDKDSAFALALNHLGRVIAWQNLAIDSLSSVYLLRAGALNHGLSPHDSLLVLADSLAAGANATDSELLSWQLVRRLFRTLGDVVDQYPEAPEAWLALGDAQYHFGGGPIVGVPDSVVLSSLRRSIELDSAFGPAYLHAIELGLNVGDTALGLRYLRDYMRITPAGSAHPGVQLAQRLLDPTRAQSAATRQLLDTLNADVLVSCRTILRRWPDSAETAVRLSRHLAERRANPGLPLPDTALSRQRLAEALAFRGHLREAATVVANRDLRIFAELAILGAVPADTARMVFRRWLRDGSIHRRLALAWWSSRGDTAAIAEFLRMAEQELVEARTQDERLAASYASAAGKAHQSLAHGDTLEALGRFRALPDSLCPPCYLDRLTRARLLAAMGDDRAALRDLSEPLHAFLTPLEVLYALERARVARRLGASELSRRDHGFVARAWRHGDLELRRRIAQSERAR